MAKTQLVTVPVNMPKEINDIRLALKSVLQDIKDKKPIAEIASGNFPKLVEAVNGYEDVDDAFAEWPQESLDCTFKFGADVTGILLVKPPQPQQL